MTFLFFRPRLIFPNSQAAKKKKKHHPITMVVQNINNGDSSSKICVSQHHELFERRHVNYKSGNFNISTRGKVSPIGSDEAPPSVTSRRHEIHPESQLFCEGVEPIFVKTKLN